MQLQVKPSQYIRLRDMLDGMDVSASPPRRYQSELKPGRVTVVLRHTEVCEAIRLYTAQRGHRLPQGTDRLRMTAHAVELLIAHYGEVVDADGTVA